MRFREENESPHQLKVVSQKYRALLAKPARFAFLFILEIPTEIRPD